MAEFACKIGTPAGQILEQIYAASEVQGFKEDVSDKTKN